MRQSNVLRLPAVLLRIGERLAAHAAPTLGIMLAGSLLLPLIGIDWIIAALGVFGGFGTLYGLHRGNRLRRRRQFLAGAAMPRAYLPVSDARE